MLVCLKKGCPVLLLIYAGCIDPKGVKCPVRPKELACLLKEQQLETAVKHSPRLAGSLALKDLLSLGNCTKVGDSIGWKSKCMDYFNILKTGVLESYYLMEVLKHPALHFKQNVHFIKS